MIKREIVGKYLESWSKIRDEYPGTYRTRYPGTYRIVILLLEIPYSLSRDRKIIHRDEKDK